MIALRLAPLGLAQGRPDSPLWGSLRAGPIADSPLRVAQGRPDSRHAPFSGRELALSEPQRGESKGGKSELRRAVRRVTPGRGNSKESGTENIPPIVARKGDGG